MNKLKSSETGEEIGEEVVHPINDDLFSTLSMKETTLPVNEQEYLKSFLQLDSHTFDQDKEKGWRKVSDTGLKELAQSSGTNTEGLYKALKIMEYYLHNYKFEEPYTPNKQLLERHIGQVYAMAGDYTNALGYIERLKVEGDGSLGEAYMDATIAFLKRDRDTLESIYNAIQLGDEGVKNKKFIISLYELFDLTYTEAYNGMDFTGMMEWLKQNP